MNSNHHVLFAGNPNVGKSTIFNALTGLKQHTGNWSGKTVELASGSYRYGETTVWLHDLPGTYSVISDSPEEEIARDSISTANSSLVVVVADATCLARSLCLLLSIMEITHNVALCVNLMDEAKRKGIIIDITALENTLNIPVIGISARKKSDINRLKSFIFNASSNIQPKASPQNPNTDICSIIKKANKTAELCSRYESNDDHRITNVHIDKILTSKKLGIPITLCFLCLILWLTITGANYPSEALMSFFAWLKPYIQHFLVGLHLPSVIVEILTNGVYHTTAWVTAVMLPPMMIFFPLFTLLEDLGYLPRLAFNLDRCFKCAGSCGKQALTMCMGLGCNAVGVTGCRIISSRRERLAAMITNCFIPCNGRFSMLITLSAIFIGGSFLDNIQSFIAALFVLGLILVGVFATLFITKIITYFFADDKVVNFVLELPPYRKPQIAKTIVRSLLDRTLKVLSRAIRVSAPVGAIIWLMANIYVDGNNILNLCAGFLDPFANVMGLDGIILLAFILALPANEIVLPIIIMGYLSSGQITNELSLAALSDLLISNGWTVITAINVMLFSLLHFPCATTLWTIKKESGSLLWTFLGFIIPTAVAVTTCMFVNGAATLIEFLCYF